MTQVLVLGVATGCGILGLALGIRGKSAVSVIWREHSRISEYETERRLLVSGANPDAIFHAEHIALGTGLFERRRTFAWLRSRADRDLLSAGETFDQLLMRCIRAGLIGLLVPFALWAAGDAGRLDVPLFVPVWVGLAGMMIGIAVQVGQLRKRAKAGHRLARISVSCFLDLVVLALAGGLGIEGALFAAAGLLDAPVIRRIRQVLEVSRDSGQSPWEGLRIVGSDLHVVELVELAAAMKLAGTEGAKIRRTLASKAASMRKHELAEAETEANLLTERLFLPGMLLLIGFMIFLGFPAISRITSGL